ncbi:MAG: NAD(P)/FAD-dependent oxidoreductase [Anaeroplasma sp.]
MKYDCIIVGAGPAGVFCAYELMQQNKNLKVLLIDKGKNIYNRKCPLNEHKVSKCPVINEKSGCYPACSITNGFGGAGAFSDGKFNITTEFGGWLTDYLDDDVVLDLIKYVDEINLKYGAPKEITNPTTDKVREIEKKGLAVGLKLLRSQVRHLGTENNLKIQAAIFDDLCKKIDMVFETEVVDVLVNNGQAIGVKLSNNIIYEGNNIFLAVGRDGSKWLEEICKKNDIKMTNNQVDIGVRVETNDIIMEEINKNLYEGKFIYRTSVGTVVRTFCSNPSGHVVVENHSGTMLANGHAYASKELGSQNTNFALLVSHKFSEPFDLPNEYAHQVSRLANELTCGGIMVQTYGDICKGRRSTQKRIDEGFVRPSLKEAVPGDLGLVLPYNTMKSIIEMIEALDHVTPGIANEHTLFYGVEAKFYSARPEIDSNFETKIKGLYVGGDGAGLTRGLAQAGANGVYVARHICKK